MRIVCFGPGPAFKGGIANYNTSLAKALDAFPDNEVHIVSWTQQYPAIIPRDFIDRASRQDQLAGTRIKVHYLTNYNNPFSWAATVKLIKELQPDKVIFQWAIALQGFPLGYIAKRLTKWGKTEVLFDIHVLVQKEASSLDRFFTKYCLKYSNTFISHALKTAEELKETLPQLNYYDSKTGERGGAGQKTILNLFHPVYDMFKPNPALDIEALKKEWGLQKHAFLFFGFIRKYKGLHNVLPAFAKLAKERDDVSLMIVGESFWATLDNTKFSTRLKTALFGFAKKLLVKQSDNEKDYNPLALIEQYGLQDRVFVVNQFVPNEDVHKYFQVADCVVNYYETATPSGVESIAYNFHMPILATKVGHFPETIQDGFNGYLAEPNNIDSMADQMRHFLAQPIERTNVAKKVAEMSWVNYAKQIMAK